MVRLAALFGMLCIIQCTQASHSVTNFGLKHRDTCFKLELGPVFLANSATAPKSSCCCFDVGGVFKKVLASSKDFFLGAVSGGVASLLVFPIDLAKTRIQDQKIVAGAELVYKNAIQTIFKVATTEGFPALYNGVAPVLIGAAPESALQIGMNNKAKAYFARKLNTQPDNLPLSYAIAAGSLGGFSQVIVTNPMERVKVLQQLSGKSGGSVLDIVKKIGVSGLYQGSKACFLRDIPFGAIYFPAYTHAKRFLVTRVGVPAAPAAPAAGQKPAAAPAAGQKPAAAPAARQETWLDALAAGLIAGVPAAGLTTPCDVIKTRMQAGGLPGTNTAVMGLRETVRTMWAAEGPSAFFKGLGPRVGRVAPQLAIALCAYEGLRRIFPDAPPAPAAAPTTTKPAAPAPAKPAAPPASTAAPPTPTAAPASAAPAAPAKK